MLLDVRLWLALCLPSIGAMLLLTGPPVATSEHVVAPSNGMPIRMRLVQHSVTNGIYPALVLVAPYCLPPDSMDVMATELARRGIVCAIPDFFGQTAAESRQRMGADSLDVMTRDVLAIVADLTRMPGIDPHRIGVAGLSVGGTVAHMAGCINTTIATIIPIGMKTEMDPGTPRNLMLLSGLYDEFRTPSSLLRAPNAVDAGMPRDIGTLYGSLAEGTARKVTIIPTCDHFTVVSDPWAIHAVVQWCEAALGVPPTRSGTMRAAWRMIASCFSTLCTLVLVALALSRILPHIVQLLSIHMPAWIAMRLTWLLLLCGIAACWAAGTWLATIRTLCADLMIALPLAYCIACFIAGYRKRTGHSVASRPFRIMACTLGAAWTSIMLSWGILAIPSFCHWPAMLPWYPVFVGMTTVLIPCKLMTLARSFLFADYHSAIVPAWPWFALMTSLIVAPDWCARLVHAIARGMEAALDSGALTRVRVGASPKTLALLAIIIATFIVILIRRNAEGMVNQQTLAMAGVIMLRFTILPMLIAWVIMRSSLFSHLINRKS